MNVGLKSLIDNNLPYGYPNIEFELKGEVFLISIGKIENLTFSLDMIQKLHLKLKAFYKEGLKIRLFIDGACKDKTRKVYIILHLGIYWCNLFN